MSSAEDVVDGGVPPVQRPIAEELDFDFEALRNSITDDLEVTQGPYRRMPAWKRYWPVAISVLLGFGIMGVWPSGVQDSLLPIQIASISGALAAILCVLAATLAPDKPALSERIAIGGLLLAALALAAQVYLSMAGPSSGIMLAGILKCGGFILGFGFLPFALLLFAMKRSRAPVRKLHVASMVTAALAIGGVAIWRTCPDSDLWHLMLGHVALPALALPVLVILVWIPLSRSHLSAS